MTESKTHGGALAVAIFVAAAIVIATLVIASGGAASALRPPAPTTLLPDLGGATLQLASATSVALA